MSRSLDDINDEEWLANFGTILGGQVTKLYNEFPDEKVCDIPVNVNACVLYFIICTYAHVFSVVVCACVCMCMYVCVRMYVHTCVCMCVCARVCVHMCMCVCVCDVSLATLIYIRRICILCY